jgi:tetratricopeptide (TPR) repeat protein
MLPLDHQVARERLARLLPEQHLAMLHLLSCRLCRHTVERELVEPLSDHLRSVRPEVSHSPRWGDWMEVMAARTTEAGRHAGELAQLSPQDARRVIAADASFRQPLVAACLLFQAEDLLDEPWRAQHLGEAARLIVCGDAAVPAGRALDLFFRAVWTVVRALRLQGRLEEAEDAFGRVLPFLGACPEVTAARAMLLSGLAQLRWSQRRLDEAAALFVQAARFFAQEGEAQGEAACRAQAGMLLVERQDVAHGRAELSRAHLIVDDQQAPALAARIALVLAWCHAMLGQAEPARERLRAARGLFDRAPDEGERILRTWWQARIAALDGQAAEADAWLDSIRRQLLATGSLGESARCTLDLLVVRVQSGRLDAVTQLGTDLLNAFKGRRGALRPGSQLDLLAAWAARGSRRFAQAEPAVRHFLAGLGPQPGGRPDLIADVRDLADRLLIAARRGLPAGTDPDQGQERP